MFIRNEAIGIDSDKVAACNNLDELKEWEFKVYETIESVKLQIANAKDNDVMYDAKLVKPLGLQKKISFLKLQEVLKKQIAYRISTLNKAIAPIRLQRERDFWKSKIKYFLPTRFEGMCEELEDLMTNTANHA